MMELEDIAVLVETVQQGSLSAAGRKLGLTPMAASRRLAALEAELDVRLAHRTTRSLSLTSEGEAFFPHAEAMLAHAAEGQAALSGINSASGLLRITASIPFGRKVVTPMLAGFLASNPALRVELRLSDAVLDITGQGIDLALRLGELRDNNLIARRLSSDLRGLYAAPDYLVRNGRPNVMADLRQHQCLTLLTTTHWTFERGGRTARQQIGGRFTADSIEALHQACLEGIGIARLSHWNVREDVESGRLVDVPLSDSAVPDHGVWAVLPTRQFVPAKVRFFLEAFSAHLAQG